MYQYQIKRNLQPCDNWRGISLLDVLGKVSARVIQNRLQVIAEGLLPDSQSGFRKGRGCTDMIFAARQLMEKTWEHGDRLFLLFVDLKKKHMILYPELHCDQFWRNVVCPLGFWVSLGHFMKECMLDFRLVLMCLVNLKLGMA